jgi:HSF-type DNA-binding
MDARPPPASKAAAVEFEDLFPAKLHYVLEQAERDGRADVIAWRPHGKAFVVKDKKEFVASFLPKYVKVERGRSDFNCAAARLSICASLLTLFIDSWFRQNQWASFQRQLNHYNFKRISVGTCVSILLP